MASRWDRCPQGHLYDRKEWHSGGYVFRSCSICRAKSKRAYRDRSGCSEWVDPAQSVAYVRALMWMGWTGDELAARTGLYRNTICRLSAADVRLIDVRTEAAVAAVFAELCMEFGPSVRTRNRAQKAGWLPPLALDVDA